MKRRTFLKTAGSATALAFGAGCISGNGGDGSDGNGGGNGSDGNGGNGDGGGGSSIKGESQLTVNGLGCGNETNASASWESSKVKINGKITGNDGCATAYLKGSGYDGSRLTLTVATKKKEGADACTKCITSIDYSLEVNFEGALPDSVTVRHEGTNQESFEFTR